eukprot:434917_1
MKQKKIIKTKNKSVKHDRSRNIDFTGYYHCLSKTQKLWYRKTGEEFLLSLCDKEKYIEKNIYDCYGPMSKDELSKWIDVEYLKKKDKYGEFTPVQNVVKYNKSSHWLQIVFNVHKKDNLGEPHGIYKEL